MTKVLLHWGQPGITNLLNGSGALVPQHRKSKVRAIIANRNAPKAPVLLGTVPDVELVHNVLMTPIDYTTYFGPADSYSMTVVPSGLTFVAGVLSGTPTTLSSTNTVITATNLVGSSDSNTFLISVVA